MADDHRAAAFLVWRGRELPPVLPARVARRAHVAQADGLCDDPTVREHRRVSALLGARDVARRVDGRAPLGARLFRLTAARGIDRVSIPGRHRTLAPPAQVRRASPYARSRSEAPPRGAPRADRGTRARPARLSGERERIERLNETRDTHPPKVQWFVCSRRVE